jgi:hypothetical protein
MAPARRESLRQLSALFEAVPAAAKGAPLREKVISTGTRRYVN